MYVSIPVHTDATLLDVTSFASVCTPCCMLLRKVWNRLAQYCWELLRPFARSLRRMKESTRFTFLFETKDTNSICILQFQGYLLHIEHCTSGQLLNSGNRQKQRIKVCNWFEIHFKTCELQRRGYTSINLLLEFLFSGNHFELRMPVF